MKRAFPILFAILLGALATAIGMGLFLKMANDDRERLAADITVARAEAAQALKDKEQIANEANQKVSAANEEVLKAQRVLQALEEEQRELAKAKQLVKPPARDVRGWQPTVSLALGIGMQLPPKTSVESNDAIAFTAVKNGFASSTSVDARWLSVTHYNERLEQELITSFGTSTPRSYLVNGRLLLGRTGTLIGASTDAVAMFRVRQTASSTHLIWIKDPGTFGYGNGFERLLSTLEFK